MTGALRYRTVADPLRALQGPNRPSQERAIKAAGLKRSNGAAGQRGRRLTPTCLLIP